jgi:hypothetical protein
MRADIDAMDDAPAQPPSPAHAPAGFILLIALLALCAGGKAILYDTLDPDSFWHLRVAEQLHRDGVGPLVDHLSFVSNRTPWTPYSWLADLGMLAVWNAGGYRLAVAVQAAMQAGIVLAMAAAAVELSRRGAITATAQARFAVPIVKGQSPAAPPRVPPSTHPTPDATPAATPHPTHDPTRNATRAKTRGGAAGLCPVGSECVDGEPEIISPRYLAAAVATAVGTFLSLAYLSFRPVTLAILLLWIITWLLLRDRRVGQSSPFVWLVVPLTALLANVHLFVWLVPAAVAAMLWGALFEQRWPAGARGSLPGSARRYALMLAATVAAAGATPMLPGMPRTMWYYGTRDAMVAGPVIAEMQFFARGPMGAVGGALVLAALICCGLRGRGRLRAAEVVCLVAGSAMLLKLGRFAPIFAMAAVPAFAATLPPLSDRLLRRPAVVALLAMVLLMGAGRTAAAFPPGTESIARWLNRNGVGTPGYPCAAADFVDRAVPRTTGRLIDEFSWGGYLEWRLGDRYQVLLDGRTQVFPTAVWQATYLAGDRQLQRYLSDVTADAALVPIGNSRFGPALRRLGWTSVYHDDRAEVLLPPTTMAQTE